MNKTVMSTAILCSALFAAPMGALAADKYIVDASHAQVLFSYEHLGFSTTYGMFSGFDGEIMFDAEDPAASSVSVSMPVVSMFTGWEDRDKHLLSKDMFNAKEGDMITFTSTGIEVTGETTAKITGDLSMNGVTKPVVLDAKMNKADVHPMRGKEWIGFDATTTLMRSDFGLDYAVPAISDAVEIAISIEAEKAE